jgi:RNA polymerase sigma factor (TIGR02999 family)
MDELIPLVYKELRLVAVAMMANERSGHTLQPTAVVNEAWVRMANSGNISPENRAHFFGIAAQSMRNVLVDHARRRLAAKRGGEMQQRVELDDNLRLPDEQCEEVLAVHEALERLREVDPRQAEVMQMHYFTGNSVQEIAEALGIAERTVKRDLQTGRLFLKEHLRRMDSRDTERS